MAPSSGRSCGSCDGIRFCFLTFQRVLSHIVLLHLVKSDVKLWGFQIHVATRNKNKLPSANMAANRTHRTKLAAVSLYFAGI